VIKRRKIIQAPWSRGLLELKKFCFLQFYKLKRSKLKKVGLTIWGRS